jgi:hypothetical protein
MSTPNNLDREMMNKILRENKEIKAKLEKSEELKAILESKFLRR